jgi:hypothetical protein
MAVSIAQKLSFHLFYNMSISKTANVEATQKKVEPAMDLPDAKPVPDGTESSTQPVSGNEAPKQQEETSLAEADIRKTKLCGICNEKEWKYKCSQCFLPT